jgi:hypothetical protein
MTTIDERNALRKQSGLPLLSVEDETRRLELTRDQARLENYFDQERHRFAHLWADGSRGFLTNMGIWNTVKKKLREEPKEGQTCCR